MGLPINCPNCRTTFDVRQAFEDADARACMDLIISLPPETIRPAFLYLTELFKPAKQTLRWSRLLKLAQELCPMISNGQIKRDGVSHTVSPELFARVMTRLTDNPPTTIVLPLRDHGYLLTILCHSSTSKTGQKAPETASSSGESALPESTVF